MLREHKNHLISLGLTDKESDVYLALLGEGSSTAEKLAKLSGLNRSTTYVQLKQLMGLGLVSSSMTGKKTLFVIESPGNLERMLDKRADLLAHQRTEVQLLIPNLMSFYTEKGIRPVVRIFEGKQGLVSMREQMLNSGVKDLYIATALDKFQALHTKSELNDFSEKRAKKKIVSHVLYVSDKIDVINIPAPNESRKIDKEKYPFSSDVYVFGDNVAFSIYGEKVIGIHITSRSVAETMLSLFKIAWHS